MRENILKLSQQKEEKTIWYQNQIVILKVFYRNVSRNRNEKKKKKKKCDKKKLVKKEKKKKKKNRDTYE